MSDQTAMTLNEQCLVDMVISGHLGATTFYGLADKQFEVKGGKVVEIESEETKKARKPKEVTE